MTAHEKRARPAVRVKTFRERVSWRTLRWALRCVRCGLPVSWSVNNPRRPEQIHTDQTALTGVCVKVLTRASRPENGSALSRANAYTTRDASTACAAAVLNWMMMTKLQMAGMGRVVGHCQRLAKGRGVHAGFTHLPSMPCLPRTL